jgi:hypothetical protein
MNLFNITVEHFVTADGKTVLCVDESGFPNISADMVTEEERAMAAIALAIYKNCGPLHTSRQHVETVTQWVRQFKNCA